jgi:hypothetical protein
MWMSWFCSCLTCVEFLSAKSVEQNGKHIAEYMDNFIEWNWWKVAF